VLPEPKPGVDTKRMQVSEQYASSTPGWGSSLRLSVKELLSFYDEKVSVRDRPPLLVLDIFFLRRNRSAYVLPSLLLTAPYRLRCRQRLVSSFSTIVTTPIPFLSSINRSKILHIFSLAKNYSSPLRPISTIVSPRISSSSSRVTAG
jgi:hypothetical protein